MYIGSDDGLLRALDVESGTPVWPFFTGSKIRSSPAVVPAPGGDIVYFGSNDNV